VRPPHPWDTSLSKKKSQFQQSLAVTSFAPVLFRSYEEYLEEEETQNDKAECDNQEELAKQMVKFEKRFFCPPQSVYTLDSSSAYVALPKGSLKYHKTTSPALTISLKLKDVLSDTLWYLNYNQLGVNRSKSKSHQTCLDSDVMDYYRFLALVYLYPEESKSFHPNYFTDLMWHAHQLRPAIYKKDCEEFYGSILDHDPWPEKSAISDKEDMKRLWEETFYVQYEWV